MAARMQGSTLVGADGEKLGRIDTLYSADDSGQPVFATVHTGLFGTRTSFVPITEARMDGDQLVVPYSKELVKEAPHLEADEHLSVEEEQRLFQHYGVGAVGGTEQVAQGGTVSHDTSGPTTDDAMTRSEERLKVGTEQVEAGRARLRKYVTTETQSQTVPVAHDEVRVQREPITDANRDKALDGPDLSEEEHEVVLTEERPVVAKETVPVERVRLDTETVTEQAQVSEEVRKEQIDTEGVYPDAERTRSSSESLR